jgi:hypothetical protein
VLPSQLGPLAALLWGTWTTRRLRGHRAFLWLAGIAPFVLFSLIQNRNLRYTLPALPVAGLLAPVGARSLGAAWPRTAPTACMLVGLLQISMAAFAAPHPPYVCGLEMPTRPQAVRTGTTMRSSPTSSAPQAASLPR